MMKLFKSNQTKSDQDNPRFQNVMKPKLSKEIKKRLKKIHVYRLTYSNPRHRGLYAPMMSDIVDRAVNLYFFTEEDALACLSQVRSDVRMDYQTIRVPLSEIIEAEGVYAPIMFSRMVPDVCEVSNAIEERNKAGFHGDSFSGVPIFQSDSLKMRDDGRPKNSSPAFFRKADLEKALRNKNKPTEPIQVTALEDVIQEMKDCSTSKWNNVVLMPPGNKKLLRPNCLFSFIIS
ncbi:hypothetical protein ACP275_14G309200 [Erythranthe tilingii]